MDIGKKNNSIQYMRAIAIVAVLLHHSIAHISNPNKLGLSQIDDILVCFHMPTFFIISGYLHEKGIANGKKTFRSFISGKTKRLLVPYVFWTVFLWMGVQIANVVAGPFMNGIGFPPMGVGKLLLNIFTYEVYYVELLWFIYVLFLYFLIHFFIGRIGQTSCFILLSLIMGFSTLFISYPNIVNRFFLWSVFFAVGRRIASDKRVSDAVRKAKRWIVPVALAFLFLCIVRIVLKQYAWGDNLFMRRTIMQAVKYAIGFLGVWLIYVVSCTIHERYATGCIMKTVGDYSYEIYLMHNPYIVAVVTLLCDMFFNLPGICTMVISTLLGILVPIEIKRRIISRSKLLSAVMVGQW